MLSRYLLILSIILFPLSINAATWDYAISGDLSYNWGPVGYNPVLDGGSIEFSFTIDESIRVISPGGETVVFAILESSLYLYDSIGAIVTSSQYVLSADPNSHPVPALLINKYEQSEATRLDLVPELTSDIAYHSLGFYNQNLPRSDINPSDLAQMYYFAGNQNTDGNYLIQNMSLSVSTIPVPATFWLFGSALIGLVGLKRKG
jgi:hypothetical protein